jgi:hypothetical protein
VRSLEEYDRGKREPKTKGPKPEKSVLIIEANPGVIVDVFKTGSIAIQKYEPRAGAWHPLKSTRIHLHPIATQRLAELLPPPKTCRCCHCTDEKACVGGCSWLHTGPEDVCSVCLSLVLKSDTKGEFVNNWHPWCCAASQTTPTSPVFWLKGSGWVVKAAENRTQGVTVTVVVRFCPFCAKELPDAVELQKLYKKLRRKR